MHLRYEDFRLNLFGEFDTGYTVEAQGPDDNHGEAPFVLQVDTEMQAALTRLENGVAPTLAEMRRVGECLHQALFPTPIRLAYERARDVVPAGTYLRLNLHLHPPELARLPWELLHNGENFLVARLTDPLVRFIEPVKSGPAKLPRRMQILHLQANPRGQNRLRLTESERVLLAATQDWAEVKVLREATLGKLLEALLPVPGYDILHFDGHGYFDPDAGQGYLLFQDEQGNEQPLTGEMLTDWLAGKSALLVVLMACESGVDSARQRFLGVAQRLMHLTDLPAVVAMQFAINDEAAIAFTRGFYQALAEGYPVEGAVCEGRKAVLEQAGGYEQGSFAVPDWAAPALFMRVTDGQLFPSVEALQPQRVARRLVEGIARLPTDYSTRIQNFLIEHLGTDQQRVPFGGRDAELAALDAWLANEHAPAYALLAAEAGRGKSTLLVHWAQRLLARGDAQVLFVPISIHHRTASAAVLFTSLAAQLREVYGDPVPWDTLSAEQWRGIVQDCLRNPPPDGRQVVLILDGLDEAADWQAGPNLFPALHTPGIRIVVSARLLAGDVDEHGWLGRLGWERPGQAYYFPLPLLSRVRLREVLRAMGNPLDSLASNINVINELYRLSENGDPFLVRLYAEALQTQGGQDALLTPDVLGSIELPGLPGYFARWWGEQWQFWGPEAPLKEEAVQVLLDLLACALGPLEREALLQIAPPEKLSYWSLTAALIPLRRLVVGDGERRGYIFDHLRLGQYFWVRLGANDRAFWEGRFLAFGRQILERLNSDQLTPENAPAYAVRYYGLHLERAQAPLEELAALVTERWMRAREALEGTLSGFLEDIGQAWQRAEVDFLAQRGSQGMNRSKCLTLQIKCALCQSSVAALSANLPPELLTQALVHELLTPAQALAIAQQIPDEGEGWRVEALGQLVTHLAVEQLHEVWEMARALEDKRDQASILRHFQEIIDSAIVPAR